MAPNSSDLSDPSTKRSTQRPITEDLLKQRAQEMGTLGLFFGSKENAPTYIAGIICFEFIVMMAGVLFIPISGDVSKTQALQFLGGFFLAALGYLFGSVSGRSKS